jgi:ribosomal protein S1
VVRFKQQTKKQKNTYMKQITSPNSGIAAPTSLMAALLANMDLKNPNHGDIVEGEVVASTRGGFLVSIGTKSDAYISADECIDLKVGDKAKFIVIKRTDSDEEFTLSQNRVAAVEQRNAAWTKLGALVESNGVTTALVSTLTHSKATEHFSGVEAIIDGVTCFIPRRELVVFGDPNKLLNTLLPVKVTKIDRESGRHGEVILSHAKAVQEQQHAFLSTLKRGTIITGKVTRILADEKGVLVDLGETTGLVHRSELSDNRSARTADLVTMGQELTLEVIKVDLVKLAVHLSVKSAAFKSLKCGEVVDGIVVNVAPFGIFVTLHGCVDGLLHESELDGQDKASFAVRQPIQVRIKGIDAKQQRVSLTRVGVLATPQS